MAEEGLRFVGSIAGLGMMVGFSFTVGMWAFCKAFKWAPVNITINTCVHEDHPRR